MLRNLTTNRNDSMVSYCLLNGIRCHPPTGTQRRLKMEEADPFDFNRLYHDEKYCLNNMTLCQARFPTSADQAYSVWSDRVEGWNKARLDTKSNYRGGDEWWAGVQEDSLLAFAVRIAEIVQYQHKVTGARIVRFTNKNQYPVLRLDIVTY